MMHGFLFGLGLIAAAMFAFGAFMVLRSFVRLWKVYIAWCDSHDARMKRWWDRHPKTLKAVGWCWLAVIAWVLIIPMLLNVGAWIIHHLGA